MRNDIDDFDFSDEGDLDIPTMRGNANLDVQDYQRYPGAEDSSFLDDELQEDTPSTPGSGAGPAFDIDGISPFELADDAGDEQNEPSYPWGPGSGGGYRPHSMNTDLSGDDATPAQEVAMRTAGTGEQVRAARQQQRNAQPSNAGVDPLTVYDRESFEYDDSPGDVIGTGIFGEEENVAWRTRDGQFEHNYALPAYIAQEGELDTQQSEMWDSVANNWRVTQPSGGGVTFSRTVASLRPPPNGMMPEMRQERTGPRSHIEAFGRAVAKAVVDEARHMPHAHARSSFLTNAAESLGVGQATRCRQVADRLVSMGYKPDHALEDTLAHCVMHATMKDLADRRNGKNGLPRIDKLGAGLRSGALQQAVQQHVAPIAVDKNKQQADVAALVQSPAAAGMGQVATPEASTSNTGRNLLIGAAVAGVGYYLLTRTKEGRAVQRNARRQARRFARKLGVK